MVVHLDYDKPLRPSKHFRNRWMRRWDWDMHELRTGLKESHKTVKVGPRKFEVYTRHGARRGGSRKLILVDYPEEIFVISGAEGSDQQ